MPAPAKEAPRGSDRTSASATGLRASRLLLVVVVILVSVVTAAIVVAVISSDSSPAAVQQSPKPAAVSMPDLFGTEISDAASKMSVLADISVNFYGPDSGLVTGQEIAPGQVVKAGDTVDIYTTNMPVNLQPRTVSHNSRHAGVNLDAPMADAYDATFKTASKMWLQDKNGARARGFCAMTSRTMRDTLNEIGGLIGTSAPQVQVLVQNTAQAEVACEDVQERYGSGRWPGVSS